MAQSETDLQLKRRELDSDRKTFDSDRTGITVDGDRLNKDREEWLAEKERTGLERKQLDIEKEQVRVEREKLEQDKRLLASMPGSAALPSQKPPIDAASSKLNLKETSEMFEGMSPEVAAFRRRPRKTDSPVATEKRHTSQMTDGTHVVFFSRADILQADHFHSDQIS